MNRTTIILCSLMLAVSASLAAEPKPSELEASGIGAMAQGDYAHAESIFRELVELRPDSFVGHYNLSAALSMQGDGDAAVVELSKAITIGFTDLAQIKRDPDLKLLRTTPFYTDLLAGWDELIEARRASDLTRIGGLITGAAQERTDEALKLELRSAHDQTATDQALSELDLIAGWASANLFSEETRPGALNDLPWITIVLPDRTGFTRWALTVFGPGAGAGSISAIGGAYEHQQRRLVAQDLGATLRHEFIHVLHWRDMNRLGQAHAPWIQEGLASLVEDYDLADDRLVPVASWRTNIVKRMRSAHRLPSIEELASTEMNAFTSNRPLAKYAQARTIMLFLLDQHRLTAFYKAYTGGYAADPSGVGALESVLGEGIDEIEHDYRDWIDRLETVPETGSDLSATLGIEIENGSGDGVVVKGLPGASRSRTGLRLGSVITAIDGRPTRDLFELIRILGTYRPGETVTLSVRRGKLHSSVEVELLGR